MKNYLMVGIVIENDKGEILLGKKRDARIYPGCWILPGGGIDEGESIRDAVKREAREELGVEVEIIKNLNFDEDFTEKVERSGEKNPIHFIALTFLTRIVGGELSPNDDIADLTWFPKEKLKSLNHNPMSQRLFESLGWIS